jgi:hypothetical protein
MAAIEYTPAPEGIAALANGPEMRAMLHAKAEVGAQWVRANAPRDSGDFADSIRVVDAGRGGPRRDRAAVDIVATSPHAVYVEQGARGKPGHRLLARSVDLVEGSA